jgi:hypothetical protein
MAVQTVPPAKKTTSSRFLLFSSHSLNFSFPYLTKYINTRPKNRPQEEFPQQKMALIIIVAEASEFTKTNNSSTQKQLNLTKDYENSRRIDYDW